MDKLANIPGDVIDQVVPTLTAFHPLVEKNKEKITGVPKQSFKFGETERHFLDVYYPASGTSSDGKAPVLFFIYGGGFTRGSRNMPPPFDFLHSCVGAFFALQGFITVLPDYRLAPEFQYPKAAEDVLSAMNWVVSHPSDLVSGTSPNPDLNSLFLSGHSAGAVHAATILFNQDLIPANSALRKRMKGVVLMSGGFNRLPGSSQHSAAYWGSEENAAKNSPTSLLLSWFANSPGTKLPKILIVQAENEPERIYSQGIEYKRLLEWHSGESVAYVEGKSHNHISLICCLLSGEGEEWGSKAAGWIRDVFRGSTTGVGSSGDHVLEDVKETDAHECAKCQKRRTRSFEIKLGSWTAPSKSFASCSNCGNKWSW